MVSLQAEGKSLKDKKIVSPLKNGVGRRKSSVARAWLKKGTGLVVVNGKELNSYFDTVETRTMALNPLVVCSSKDIYDILINVNGGGITSQSGAVSLAISRALLKKDESLRLILRANKLLTVDSRVKERKKPGQKGARRKFQFVKR